MKVGENQKMPSPNAEEASKPTLGATMMPLVSQSMGPSTARRPNSCTVPALCAHCAKGAPKSGSRWVRNAFFQK